jgi:predicted dehydrogenase
MSQHPRSVRVALLGTGAIAQVAHLPILARMRGVEVVGLYDAERARARTLAERFGVPTAYRSGDELWSDPDVEAVVLASPSGYHEEQVRQGLAAGKYVFCEKPLALNAEGARAVLASPGADSRLMVGMNQRFRPDAAALKSFVAGGDLGDVYHVRAGWLNRGTALGRRSWRQRKAGAGGGALMDLGIQMLDLSLWMLDYPAAERLTAHLHRRAGAEVEDAAFLLVCLEGGRVLDLEVTWALLAERERQYLDLQGTDGSASLSPVRVYKDLDGSLLDVSPQIAPGRENQFTASYRLELARFVDAVREGESLPAPAEHVGLLTLVDAAYRSAEEGREVRL